MRSRERQSEIMDWIKRSNCDICAVNKTGLTGEEYMEVSDGYSWFAANYYFIPNYQIAIIVIY